MLFAAPEYENIIRLGSGDGGDGGDERWNLRKDTYGLIRLHLYKNQAPAGISVIQLSPWHAQSHRKPMEPV
eukprot:1902071-Amphidinium_carterae.1